MGGAASSDVLEVADGGDDEVEAEKGGERRREATRKRSISAIGAATKSVADINPLQQQGTNFYQALVSPSNFFRNLSFHDFQS